jgi:cytochrome P450 family 6
MYDLACNLKVQERLREEVDSVMDQHNGQLNLDIIQEMEYLDMVVQGNINLYHLMTDSTLEDHSGRTV